MTINSCINNVQPCSHRIAVYMNVNSEKKTKFWTVTHKMSTLSSANILVVFMDFIPGFLAESIWVPPGSTGCH